MLGFKFLENFDVPYIAQSIKDFWRRWHISLSTWFRDYLYVPMGGNRCSEGRNYFNLLTVFFLCGLWHGASWTFAVWGLYHGTFLVLERSRLGSFQARWPRPLRHVYALFIVMMGWVLFRADSFAQALAFFQALFGMSHASVPQPLGRYLTHETGVCVIFGSLFCLPLWSWCKMAGGAWAQTLGRPWGARIQAGGLFLEMGLALGLLGMAAIWLASSTYNPFIYFRF
jgi:alginate O-acetyltransferase complex protein AlgI